MKFYLYTIVGLFLIASCQETKVDYVVVSGRVTNTESGYVTIKNNGFSSDIDFNDDGTFYDTLRVNAGYYHLYVGRERTPIYLQAGKNLEVNVDFEKFDSTIVYTGTAAAENNYLAQKTLASINSNLPFQELYGKDEADFVAAISENQEKQIQMLQNADLKNDDFSGKEKKSIQYGTLTAKSNFESYHQFVSKDEYFSVSDGFLNEINTIDLDNKDEFEAIASYKKLVNSYFGTFLMNRDIDAAFEQITGLQSSEIKDYLAGNLRYDIKPGNEDADKIYVGIVSITKDSATLAYVNSKIVKIRKLGVGMPSPDFAYQSIGGDQISLADLSGKYLYVDVWATWCGPCLREIPSLKALEEEYHDKNVAFVSISVDKESDFEKWQNMIASKELGGVQLFADNNWQSDFVQAYAIDGIPRFIIIDPQGNIVDPDAKRPSNPELREFFERI